MVVTRISVSGDVLVWARKTAGLDVDTAATRIGVKVGRLLLWESGDLDPTMNQLRSIAKTYHRPLAALFLSAPLQNEVREQLPDYRRRQTQAEVDPRALQSAVMRARRQRDALRDIADELDWPDNERVANFSLSSSESVEDLGLKLRQVMQLDLLPKSTVRHPDQMLRAMIRRAEDLNVNVIQVQRVSVKVMRGFSLGEGACPVIALNGSDWPRGKIFTLLHEIAHVGFSGSGLCDLEQDHDPEIEKKCNEIAAATLMPAKRFSAMLSKFQGQLTVDDARGVGNEFGASGEAAVLRMISLGLATWDDYRRLKEEFEGAYQQYKDEEKSRNSGEAPPIFYQLRARDLGRGFIQNVLSAYGESAISSRDLVQLLGVSFDKVPKLAATIGENF